MPNNFIDLPTNADTVQNELRFAESQIRIKAAQRNLVSESSLAINIKQLQNIQGRQSKEYLEQLRSASSNTENQHNRLAVTVQQSKTTTEKFIKSSRIGKVQNINPLSVWSSEIVDIELPTPQPLTEQLRRRNINQMHSNKRREDTVASIKIVKSSSSIKNIRDDFRNSFAYGSRRQPSADLSTTDVLFETTNFVLQAIGETDSEKHQIIDSFGDPQLFMFGRRPRVYTYSGMLWNNDCNNWKDEFRFIYDKYFRGTKCVEYGVKILLTYDRSVRVGYMLNATINQVADVEMAVPFNFSMFIEDQKELIDESILDPGDTGISQNIFGLVNEQAAATKKEVSDRETVINKKLEIIIEPQMQGPPAPKATMTGISNVFQAPPELKTTLSTEEQKRLTLEYITKHGVSGLTDEQKITAKKLGIQIEYTQPKTVAQKASEAFSDKTERTDLTDDQLRNGVVTWLRQNPSIALPQKIRDLMKKFNISDRYIAGGSIQPQIVVLR